MTMTIEELVNNFQSFTVSSATVVYHSTKYYTKIKMLVIKSMIWFCAVVGLTLLLASTK